MSTVLVNPRPRRLLKMRHLFLGLFVAVVCIYLVLPTLFIIPMSFNASSSLGTLTDGWTFKWYQQLVEDPVWAKTAWVSLKVGVGATAIATVAGTLLSLALVRFSSKYRTALRGLSLAPMVVPPVILGVGLYVLFLGIGLYGSIFGFILAHAALALPFVVVSVSTSLAEFDPSQEQAALILGANRRQAFVRVVLPQIVPGIISGALFGFVTSWDEVVVSTFLAAPGIKTLPVEMWTQARTTLTPTLAALSTLLIIISTSALLLVNVVQNRQKGKEQ